jgi:hypothetical protein
MEPDKIDRYAFLQWLHENPSIFMPTAWQRFTRIKGQKLKNSQTINCFLLLWLSASGVARHQLGEQLRDCLRKEIDDPGEPTPTTIDPLTNITQTLPQSIEDSYKKIQKRTRCRESIKYRQ